MKHIPHLPHLKKTRADKLSTPPPKIIRVTPEDYELKETEEIKMELKTCSEGLQKYVAKLKKYLELEELNRQLQEKKRGKNNMKFKKKKIREEIRGILGTYLDGTEAQFREVTKRIVALIKSKHIKA